MSTLYLSPNGSDSNSGTSETQAWKSLAVSPRLQPGQTLLALPGTYPGTFAPPSGTAAAPITFQAKDPGTVTLEGSKRVDGLSWQRSGKGWSAPFAPTVFGVFARTYETAGKLTSFADRHFNQYGSNPGLDLQGVPAEFKWDGGVLRLNPIAETPSSEPIIAAVTEVALMLNGRSHVVVEGITTRGYKHAVATNTGTGIYLNGCRFGYSGSTAVWLVGLADAAMTNCVVQGGGSWMAHVEDLIHTERVGNLRLEGLDLSYGGHSGLIMLSGVPGKIVLKKCYFHAMGGSLLTLKRSVDNLLVEDCWFAEAAKSTAVDAHKVPHAGVQLSGRGHVFRNTVFRDNGKDILASSDGNADSNPVCSDNLFDHCTFSGSEAGAVEGQEYAPAGRLERNTWRDCIIKGDLALFYAGQGDRASNRLVHCQVVGSTNRGVVAQDCSSDPLPNTGSALTAPPVTGGGGGGGGGDTKPLLAALTPTSGRPGDVVRLEGERFGKNPAVVVTVPVSQATLQGKLKLANLGGSDTAVAYMVPALQITGSVFVRNTETGEASNELLFTVTQEPPPADLRVTLTAAPSPTGATFSGAVTAVAPLPAGSTVSVSVVRKSDGKVATGLVTIVGEPPPPPPPPGDLPAEVVKVIRLHNILRAGGGLPALSARMRRAAVALEGEIGDAWSSGPPPSRALTSAAAAAATGPLAENAALTRAARGFAEEMLRTGVFSHTGEGGSTPFTRMAAAGYRGATMGENLAKRFSNPESVMRAWEQSPGHLSNILSPAFTQIGCWVSGTIWVVDFGG